MVKRLYFSEKYFLEKCWNGFNNGCISNSDIYLTGDLVYFKQILKNVITQCMFECVNAPKIIFFMRANSIKNNLELVMAEN